MQFYKYGYEFRVLGYFLIDSVSKSTLARKINIVSNALENTVKKFLST